MTRASAIYRNPYLYQALMRVLYGRYYEARYRAVAAEIPEETEVVELCAGDCRLYLKHLRSKQVRYVALDNARPLVDWARRQSGRRNLNTNQLSALLGRPQANDQRGRLGMGFSKLRRGRMCFEVPSLAEARRLWNERRFDVSWDDAEDWHVQTPPF